MNSFIKNSVVGLVSLAMLTVGAVTSYAQVNQGASATSAGCVTLNNNLHVGSTDAGTSGEVSVLQRFLVTGDFLSVTPTGYFGRLTLAAVRTYQSAHELPSTGFVGPMTRASIHASSCNDAQVPLKPAAPVQSTTTSVVSVNTTANVLSAVSGGSNQNDNQNNNSGNNTPNKPPVPEVPATTTPTVVTIPGDINGDGKVDFADLLSFAQNFNGPFDAKYDLNKDGLVNKCDLALLGANYGKTSSDTPVLFTGSCDEPTNVNISSLTGDMNHDGKVDFADLLSFAQQFSTSNGAHYGDSNYNFALDLNLDGVIDIHDLNVLADNYGKTGTSVAHLDGDVNNDGVVNFADLLLFAQNYPKGHSTHVGLSDYNPVYDLNHDGTVDQSDFNILKANYGGATTTTQSQDTASTTTQ